MAVLAELQQQEPAAAEATYDVFLSFRGIDTRLSFTDHLYRALLNENIPTFLDEEEVETGQDLKPELARAIKTSRASVIVLFENYATSTWCLDELVMILEQRRTSNHIVLPIFYHVEPTHVRKQQSSFGDALVTHKLRMEAEENQDKKSQYARKLALWTKGLTEVADLKGKDANGRPETVLIEEIVKEISSRLSLHLRSKIPHLIGMDFSISAISSWLKESSSKTGDILTIWGMGGIGKTTLAEYIYRLHYHEFERSSFLEGIERKCAQQSSALLDLQKQLLGDILKRSTIEIHDRNGCTPMLEKTLFNKQMLVVLDGIDKLEQLDALIGTKGFHRGCKIIITTKDGSLTEKRALFRTTFPPKHLKHTLYCLSDTNSLRLLCWHAFGGNISPKEGYEEEARRVAKYCGGHPLALKVLGSSLINEDVATWRDIFGMLETKEFDTDIHNILRIRFDSLPSENCKELFKHIACFFVGKDREVTETILKECGIRTSYGITKLVDRCLITIGAENELKMHQLLQEMGRDLVRQESPIKPWKHSRLWNHEECLNLLIEDKGTAKIQGLVLDMEMLEKESLQGSTSVPKHKFQDHLNKNIRVVPSIHGVYEFFLRIWCLFAWFFMMFSSSHGKQIELRTYALAKMDKLNLLQLNHVKLNGSYKNFPKGLRWLCMHGFRLKYIPSELPVENLVALDMSYSDLKQLWKKPKRLGSLKILILSYSKIVRVGGFSELPALERLILSGCASLIEVCESIGRCDRLVFLDMSYCNKLKKLPRSISKLKKVRILSINGFIGASEFPIEMRDMESLNVLKADSVIIKSHAFSSSVTELVPRSPKSFLLSLPRSLAILSLKDNNLFNESFPTDFSSLSMLEELYLDENQIDDVPDCVRRLSRLEVLNVARCSMLKSVLCLPRTVHFLSTQDCSLLKKITFHPEISRVPIVNYMNTKSLIEIEGIMNFQALSQIDEKILRGLGWTNLDHVKDQKVELDFPYSSLGGKIHPVQVKYEFGIFSTCFLGKEVPNWLAHGGIGSSMSFIIPSSPMNKRIQGLNICFVHTFLGEEESSILGMKIRNVTKNRTWIYIGSVYVVREADKDIVWLSHWMFGNELEDGDKVSVTILEDEKVGLMVRECAMSLVYNDGDKEEDPLSYYRSWKQIIGGDLSYFELTSGDYLLFNLDFYLHFHSYFQKVWEDKAFQNFVGYTPQYKDVNGYHFERFHRFFDLKIQSSIEICVEYYYCHKMITIDLDLIFSCRYQHNFCLKLLRPESTNTCRDQKSIPVEHGTKHASMQKSNYQATHQPAREPSPHETASSLL